MAKTKLRHPLGGVDFHKGKSQLEEYRDAERKRRAAAKKAKKAKKK